MKKINVLVLGLVGLSCISCVVSAPPARVSGSVYFNPGYTPVVQPTYNIHHHNFQQPTQQSWNRTCYQQPNYQQYSNPTPIHYYKPSPYYNSSSTNFNYRRNNFNASVNVNNQYYGY